MRKIVAIALFSLVTSFLILTVQGKATAQSFPDGETCSWSDTTGQWIDDETDGDLCRGTGEDPTTDAQGNPQCANGAAGHYSDGRFMCSVSAMLGSVHNVTLLSGKPRNPHPCEKTADHGYLRESLKGTYYSCKPKTANA